MRLLFCASPLRSTDVDPDYAGEWNAVVDAGFDRSLIDFEALLAGDPASAIRRVVAADPPTPAVYRGWMLPLDRYRALYTALDERGVNLKTSPDAYRLCHHLPAWYPTLEGLTPRSVWLTIDEGLGIDNIMGRLSTFGNAPVIVKDFVKSRKHEWNDACFIRSASDRTEVGRVVGNFIRGQGADLAEGLVFREYVDLHRLAVDPRTRAPVNEEYRLFYVDGKRLLAAQHFDPSAYTAGAPFDPAAFDEAAARIPSPFFAMDVARTVDGGWIVIELGDGQVAGLPDSVDPVEFYRLMSKSAQ